MSTQHPESDSPNDNHSTAAPTARFGAPAAVVCPTCGTQPADSIEQANRQAEWCERFGHGEPTVRRA